MPPSPASPIRVAVTGALGKMGREVVKTVLADPELTLVGALVNPRDLQRVGQDAALAVGLPDACGVALTADLTEVLRTQQPAVCVDFTHPDVVLTHALQLVEHGCRPVIGTTGLDAQGLAQLQSALTAKGLGGIVAPNFAIGAVLMMKFAQEAARYFDHGEIIELHHNRKADAPSGTALKTAELMAERQAAFGPSNGPEKETLPGARGAQGPANLRIHSVRLPGLVAHQEVLFGAPGQLLTLRHDSLDRTCFMPGVALAVKKAMALTGLVYGLEHLL